MFLKIKVIESEFFFFKVTFTIHKSGNYLSINMNDVDIKLRNIVWKVKSVN